MQSPGILQVLKGQIALNMSQNQVKTTELKPNVSIRLLPGQCGV